MNSNQWFHVCIVVLVTGLVIVGCTGAPSSETTSSSVDLETAQAAARNAEWGDNVTITIDGDTLKFTSDGLPNHVIQPVYQDLTGETVEVLETKRTFSITLQPVLADSSTVTTFGSIGFVISGAVFYNPYEVDDTVVAVENNFELDENGNSFLDGCNGHPVVGLGQYHYHGVPYCITNTLDTEEEHSKLIGYLYDGFPVYGPKGAEGEAPTDLDHCNGHDEVTPDFSDGIYHYHTTETSLYVPHCYAGVIDSNTAEGTSP